MFTRKRLFGSATLAAVFTLGLVAGMNMPAADSAEKNRVFELRTYYTNEGKLDALHARFRDHTMGLFEKHGMENIAYWTLEDGEGKDSTLVYIITHESREAAKDNWKNFGSDPDWRKVYKASRADGALVKKVESQFLVSTDYSPLP